MSSRFGASRATVSSASRSAATTRAAGPAQPRRGSTSNVASDNGGSPVKRRQKLSAEEEAIDRAAGVALAVAQWARLLGEDELGSPLATQDVHRVLDALARLDRELSDHAVMPIELAVDLVTDTNLDIAASLATLARSSNAPYEVANAALVVLKRVAVVLDGVDFPAAEQVLRLAMTTAVALMAKPSEKPDGERSRALNTSDPQSLSGGPPLHLSASAVALAATYKAAHLAPLISIQVCEDIISGVTSAGVHPAALYNALAVLHRFAHEQPQRQHAALLAAAKVHTGLLAVLSGTTGSGWHATPRGIALHVLAALTEHQPDVMRPLVDSSFVASSVMTPLRSEWSEVLEGGFLFAAALCRLPQMSTKFFNAFVAQHAAQNVAGLATGASSIRVAAAAASCLRGIVQYAPVGLNVPAMLFADQPTLRQLIETLRDPVTATDAVGQRIAKTHVAIALTLGLCRSAEHRSTFARALVGSGLRLEPADVAQSLAAAIDGVHPTLVSQLTIYDADGTDLSNSPFEFDPVTALPSAESVCEVLGRCRGPPRTSVLAATSRSVSPEAAQPTAHGSNASMHTVGHTHNNGVVNKCILRAAVWLVPAAVDPSTRPTAREDREAARLRRAAATHSTSGLGAAPVSAAAVFHQAFELAVRLSKAYQPQSTDALRRDEHDRLASSPPADTYEECEQSLLKRSHLSHIGGVFTQSRVERLRMPTNEGNVWHSPPKHYGRRTWTATEVERRDLFIVAVPWTNDPASNVMACRSALGAAEEHLVALNAWLQTCPTTKIRRRALLNDLYVHVVPRIIASLEYLEAAAGDADRTHRVLDLLRHRVASAAAAGTATRAAATSVAPVAVHCGNLLEVCAALSAL